MIVEIATCAQRVEVGAWGRRSWSCVLYMRPQLTLILIGRMT
jgi:hypothetical protein